MTLGDAGPDVWLDGVWRNQLGSRVRLVAELDGSLAGTYESAVGDTRLPQPLLGQCEAVAPSGPVVLGFVVRWPAAGSVAVWAGTIDDRLDRIHASWLLVEGREAPGAWGSTRTGTDEFRREEELRGEEPRARADDELLEEAPRGAHGSGKEAAGGMHRPAA